MFEAGMRRRAPKHLAAIAMMATFGRRNVVRLSRFLLNEARLDVPNDMATNGELLVQARVLERTPSNEPLTVADIGANVGEWTYAFLSLARDSHAGPIAIHAFEPDGGASRRFRTSLPSLPDGTTVELNLLGLSDKPGKEPFYVVGPAAGTNSLYLPPETTAALPVERVTLTTLDTYAAQKGIERFGLVKIDTEGHDLRVMEGARRLLEAGNINVLQFEYNHRWIGSRSYLRDAFELMTPLGYRLGKVTPKGIEIYDAWHPELETYREGNYLACRQEWISAFPVVTWWNAG